MPNRTRTVLRLTAAALAAAIVLGACSGGSSYQPRTITLTLIRHAESESNAEGVIATDVPGPGLTEEGRKQALTIAHALGRNHHDGVYTSPMLRSQQTSAPFGRETGRQVQVLPGLREIDAGWFDDKPVSMADTTYLLAPMDWLQGERSLAIPGSIDGNTFNDQFTAAVDKIYDSGDANPVAFSHSAAIMTWTLMNVKNPRNSLMTEHPLPNIGRVVITGSPGAGWKLIDWDGMRDFN
jgi:broad specificity phosphatase PhoE